MNKDCKFTIKPVDAIQGFVRIDWTMSEFFGDDGTSRFISRLASVLNIAPSRIKIAGIREGSVIVDFTVEPEDGQTPQLQSQNIASLLSLLQANIKTAVETEFGRPYLESNFEHTKVYEEE